MKMFALTVCMLCAACALSLAAGAPTRPLPRVLILLGAPGSGKGTQAMRLAKDLKLPHISTGDLFRENLSKGTALGQQAKSYMEKGQLVPDALVIDMLFDRVAKDDARAGYLLDGFPRTIAQAEALQSALAGQAQISVVNLDVPDELIVKRITGRRSCVACGNIHNIYYSAPSKDGVCDQCAGALTQRSDDTVEVVSERLKVYHQQTKPLIEFYSKQGRLVTVDGTRQPDAVYAEIRKLIDR